MKIVSWNVAGFRACLKKGFLSFFEQENPDIICIQEVKAEKNQYDFHPKGYFEYLNSAERKGYSGTLIYSKVQPISIRYGIGVPKFDIEGRSITLEFLDFYLVNLYVPNVKRTLERMDERIEWENYVKEYLRNLDNRKPVIICGDFNVAHTEIDIKNAKQNIGNAGFTYEEREKFTELLASGFIDTYRYYHPDEGNHYTWWSYMKDVRLRNIGWRIDYFLVSSRIIHYITNTMIYSDIYGSDHCPIGIEIDFKREEK